MLFTLTVAVHSQRSTKPSCLVNTVHPRRAPTVHRSLSVIVAAQSSLVRSSPQHKSQWNCSSIESLLRAEWSLRLLPALAPAAAADAFGCGCVGCDCARPAATPPPVSGGGGQHPPAATSCSGSSGSGGCVRPAATVATAALGLQGLALPPSVSSVIIGHRALWLAVWLALGRRRLRPPGGPAASSA